MLGFADVSDLAHTSEELLGGRDRLPSPGDAEKVMQALDFVARGLRGELGGDAETRLAFAEGQESLRSTLTLDTEEREPEKARADPARAKGPRADEPIPPSDEKPRVERGPSADRWVQVNARRVDELCERVSDFEMDYNGIQQSLSDLVRAMPEATARLCRPLLEDLDRSQAKLQDITSGSWALRLVPVAPTLEELAKHAHDLSSSSASKFGSPFTEGTLR